MFVERIPPSGMYRTATDRNVSSSDQSARYAISPGREWLSRERLGARRGSSPIETLIPGTWRSSCEQRDKVTVDKRKATIKRRQSLEKHVPTSLIDSTFPRTKDFSTSFARRFSYSGQTNKVLVFFSFRISIRK